jgi:hypothetical protein
VYIAVEMPFLVLGKVEQEDLRSERDERRGGFGGSGVEPGPVAAVVCALRRVRCVRLLLCASYREGFFT